MSVSLENGEYIEPLDAGIGIIQSPDGYKFSQDAVLLANAVSFSKKDKICDLGCGSGIVPLLLCGRGKPAKIIGIELQEKASILAQKSVLLNNLQDKIEIVTKDLKTAHEFYGCGAFDIVTANPPFFRVVDGIDTGANEERARSRFELDATLSDFVFEGSLLLKNGGKFYIVVRADRLAELCYLCGKNGVEAKEVKLYGGVDGAVETAVVCAVKSARVGAKITYVAK